jgi:hypothetical protein
MRNRNIFYLFIKVKILTNNFTYKKLKTNFIFILLKIFFSQKKQKTNKLSLFIVNLLATSMILETTETFFLFR